RRGKRVVGPLRVGDEVQRLEPAPAQPARALVRQQAPDVALFGDDAPVRTLDPDIVSVQHADVSAVVDRLDAHVRTSDLSPGAHVLHRALGVTFHAQHQAAHRDASLDGRRLAPARLAAVRLENLLAESARLGRRSHRGSSITPGTWNEQSRGVMIARTMATAAQAPLAPHPKDLPLIGSMAAFARDTLGAVMQGWRECGDVTRFRGLRPMTLAAHPDDVRLVLEERMDIYPRSDVVQKGLAPLVGKGIFTVGPERWPIQRRLVAPAFHGERIGLVGARVVDRANAVV